MKSNLFLEFIHAVKYRFNLDEDKAAEDEVIENITRGVEFKGINLWTLIFAIFIASIGLNVNSTAVIIGAMLISPLMGPIMGIGLGAGIFDFELIKKAGKNLLIATFIGLVASFCYFFVSPLQYAQSELLARTSPTIWDVLIAFFGGLAGIVASSRKKYNNVIPGVAIATALMPPLCTAGYGLATGQWSYFFGAFYLYLINSVFISISTFLIVRFLKFKPTSYVNPLMARKVKNWIGTIAILTILPSLYLAYNFVKKEIFVQNANKFLSAEAAILNYSLLHKEIMPDTKEILITLINDDHVGSIQKLLELKKANYNLEDAKIAVISNISGNKKLDINQLKEGIIEELFEKKENEIKDSKKEISTLKNELITQADFAEKRENAIKEFRTLYGNPNELVIDQTIRFTKSSNDTILIVYFKESKNKINSNDRDNIKNWLSVKFGIKKVKLIIE